MPSTTATWRGRLSDRAAQDRLLDDVQLIADISHSLLGLPPPERRTLACEGDILVERYPVRSAAEHRFIGRTGRIASRWRPTWAEDEPFRHEATREPFVRLERAEVYGLEFQLYDPRGNTPSNELRVSFRFLACPGVPALDGQIVLVEDAEECFLYQDPVIATADWFLTTPSVYLRYYLERWFAAFLTWLKVVHVPDMWYGTHTVFHDHEVWLGVHSLSTAHCGLSTEEVSARALAELIAWLPREAGAWRESFDRVKGVPWPPLVERPELVGVLTHLRPTATAAGLVTALEEWEGSGEADLDPFVRDLMLEAVASLPVDSSDLDDSVRLANRLAAHARRGGEPAQAFAALAAAAAAKVFCATCSANHLQRAEMTEVRARFEALAASCGRCRDLLAADSPGLPGLSTVLSAEVIAALFILQPEVQETLLTQLEAMLAPAGGRSGCERAAAIVAEALWHVATTGSGWKSHLVALGTLELRLGRCDEALDAAVLSGRMGSWTAGFNFNDAATTTLVRAIVAAATAAGESDRLRSYRAALDGADAWFSTQERSVRQLTARAAFAVACRGGLSDTAVDDLRAYWTFAAECFEEGRAAAARIVDGADVDAEALAHAFPDDELELFLEVACRLPRADHARMLAELTGFPVLRTRVAAAFQRRAGCPH